MMKIPSALALSACPARSGVRMRRSGRAAQRAHEGATTPAQGGSTPNSAAVGSTVAAAGWTAGSKPSIAGLGGTFTAVASHGADGAVAKNLSRGTLQAD